MTKQTIQATVAGYIQSSSATYATARAGGGTLQLGAGANNLRVGQSFAAGSYNLFAIYLEFDLTGVNPAEKILLVIPKLYGATAQNTLGAWEVRMYLHDFGSTFETADWVDLDTLANDPLVATFQAENHKDGAWNDYDPTLIMPDVIPTSGILRVILVSERMIDATPPDTSGVVTERLFYQELADTNKPEVEVTSSFATAVATEIWRDYVPPEVHRPIKSEIRAWGAELERNPLRTVTWYGADPTGTVRSDGAFQAAQAYATSQGGGDIYVPPGYYILGDRATDDTAIVPTSHTRWVGIGRPILINRARNFIGTPCVFDIANVEDVQVIGFFIDGEQTLRSGIRISGIVEDIVIKDNHTHDHLTYGLVYGDAQLDSELAHYLSITVENYKATGFCGGGPSIGSGINFFPRASLLSGDPASQNAIFKDIELDIRHTHGEALVAGKNTPLWVNGSTYTVGFRVKSLDGLRVYVCIYGTGTSTVEPSGTGNVIVAGTYKWKYLGAPGTVIGFYQKQPARWAKNTPYTVLGTNVLTAQSRIYELITTGTSGTADPGSVAGQETDADITDGTAHWKYIGVFRNVTTNVPYNKGRRYGPNTVCKVIAHRNLATDTKATFTTVVANGQIQTVDVDNPGTGYEKNVQVMFDDPDFTGRDATFGDPDNAFDHGTVGIKCSNADGVKLDNILIFGGLAYPINLTAGGRNYVATKIRVRYSSFGFTITGNAQAVNRKWVVCATDVDVVNNTLQVRDLPDGPVVNHGYTDGMLMGMRQTGDVEYWTEEFPSPLSGNEILYVVNATATTFKLARTLGGAPIDLLTAGIGYFQIGRSTGIKTTKMTLRDFHHTRDGILNPDGTSCRIGGDLEEVTLDNVEIDGSLTFEPHRATDIIQGLKVNNLTIHDGNLTSSALLPAETYRSVGIVGAHFGVINLYGDPTGERATGRIVLDPANASGTTFQCPVNGCTFEEVNMDGFQDHGILFSGNDCKFLKVTARRGNLLGATTAAIVIDRGLRNSFPLIISRVPARGIAAFVPNGVYALNDLMHTYSGNRKRFYKVVVPGTAGPSVPAEDNDVTSNQVNFQFLWSQSCTLFYWNDKGGTSLPFLSVFEGECIDIADGVADKGTQLLRLENFSGSVASGGGLPYSEIHLREAPFTLSAAGSDVYRFDSPFSHFVIGWTLLVTTNTDANAGVATRTGIITAAGVVDNARFGSLTSPVSQTVGYMHAVANTTGTNSFSDRLLPPRAQLTNGCAGGKTGTGAVALRAWLGTKR